MKFGNPEILPSPKLKALLSFRNPSVPKLRVSKIVRFKISE